MTALRLYLVRHGEPDPSDMFYGHADVPLSARGREQSAAVAQALAGLSLVGVYSSDLARAADCAAMIAATGDLRPQPVALPELREMHLGVLERVPFREGRARVPELARLGYDDLLDHRMPGGGESVRDLAGRVVPCVAELIVRHARAPGSGRGAPPAVVVVAHNTVNRVVLARATGLGPGGYTRFEQGLGSLSRIDLGDAWSRDDPWAATRLGLLNWTPETGRDGVRGF